MCVCRVVRFGDSAYVFTKFILHVQRGHVTMISKEGGEKAYRLYELNLLTFVLKQV